MSHEEQLPEELIELECMLGSFEPAPSRIDRDWLMFDAGAAWGVHSSHHTPCDEPHPTECDSHFCGGLDRRRLWASQLWPLSACAAVLIACVFASLYAAERRRPPVVVREVVMIERAEPLAVKVVETAAQRPSARRESAGTPHPAFRTPHSALILSFWPFTFLQPPTTNHQPPTTSHQPPATYFALRRLVLARGVDALPRREDASGVGVSSERPRPPSTIRELMKEFLPSPAIAVSTEAERMWQSEPTTYGIGDTI